MYEEPAVVKDKPKRTPKRKAPRRSARRLAVRQVPGQSVFELVHPPSVAARADDMEQVHVMLQAGEMEIAVDELRWLVAGCHELLEAHKLLGEIALSDGNLALARAHFGYAYQLGLRALPKAGLPGPLPSQRPANQTFFEAGKGLAHCLQKLGETKLAAEVVDQFIALDPSDPLALEKQVSEGNE